MQMTVDLYEIAFSFGDNIRAVILSKSVVSWWDPISSEFNVSPILILN